MPSNNQYRRDGHALWWQDREANRFDPDDVAPTERRGLAVEFRHNNVTWTKQIAEDTLEMWYDPVDGWKAPGRGFLKLNEMLDDEAAGARQVDVGLARVTSKYVSWEWQDAKKRCLSDDHEEAAPLSHLRVYQRFRPDNDVIRGLREVEAHLSALNVARLAILCGSNYPLFKHFMNNYYAENVNDLNAFIGNDLNGMLHPDVNGTIVVDQRFTEKELTRRSYLPPHNAIKWQLCKTTVRNDTCTDGDNCAYLHKDWTCIMGRPRSEWDPTATGPYSARDRDIGRDSYDSGADAAGPRSARGRNDGRDDCDEGNDTGTWKTWGDTWSDDDDDDDDDDNHTWKDGPWGKEYRGRRGKKGW